MNANELYEKIQDLTGVENKSWLKHLPENALETEGQVQSVRDLSFYLEALILELRGPSEKNPNPFEEMDFRLNNNKILKKLRVAFSLKTSDLEEIFASTGEFYTHHEIGTLFRAEGHKHFKKCDTPTLFTFLAGYKIWNTTKGSEGSLWHYLISFSNSHCSETHSNSP